MNPVTHPKKVFLTGGSGFIGSHLAERLVNDGFQVRALVRRSADTSLLRLVGVDTVPGDLSDAPALQEALADCSHVYHLAAKTTTSRSTRNEYYLVNVQGTENLCRAAVNANVERFVHGSSAGIYGLFLDAPVDETSKANPNSFYRHSKHLAEKIVLDYHRNHNLPVVIARLSSVYGPRSPNWRKLFQDVAAKRFCMIGSGNNRIQMGYVSDIVDGLRLCGHIPNIEGRDYILAGNESVTVKNFVDLIADEARVEKTFPTIPSAPFYLLGRLGNLAFRIFRWEIPFSHQTDFFLTDKVFSITKAKTDLGYSPKVTLKEGIKQTMNWYREKGYI